MKTLQLRNGDLVVGSGGYVLVEGSQKLYQDLSVLVREALGEDRFHPRWGTILHEYVGRTINDDVTSDVRNEISRLLQNYMIMQSRQIQADQSMSRRPRYQPAEILVSVEGIDFQQKEDHLNVRVRVGTGNGETVDILRTVGF